jgi:hypothetical protein
MVVPAKRRAEAEPETTPRVMASDIIVAKRGDVRLKLGNARHAITNVLVSSVVLGLASPVFEAMFNGNFAEGQSHSASSPREVPLPDDDVDSMLLISKITHMQTADLARELSVAAFTVFAVICDKYQCNEAVLAWSKVWSAAIFQHPPEENFEEMVMATYVLDLPYEFYKATVILIRDRSTDAKITSLGTHLPLGIFDTLQLNKRQVEAQAHAVLDSTTVHWGVCRASREALGKLVVELRNVFIWPIRAQAISEIRKQMANLPDITNETCKDWTCKCKETDWQVTSSLITKMDHVYKSATGICLDCVRPNASNGPVQCRIEHDAAGYMSI